MTNATLITEKNIEKIIGFFDSIKISLDGNTAKKHDFYRGRGSYERTIKAVELPDKFGAVLQQNGQHFFAVASNYFQSELTKIRTIYWRSIGLKWLINSNRNF